MDAGLAAILGALSGAALTEVMGLVRGWVTLGREDRRLFFDSRRMAYGALITAGKHCILSANWLFHAFYDHIDSSLTEVEAKERQHASDDGAFDLQRTLLSPIDSDAYIEQSKSFWDSLKLVDQVIAEIQMVGSPDVQKAVSDFDEWLQYANGAIHRLSFAGFAVGKGLGKEASDAVDPIKHIDWLMIVEKLEIDLDTFKEAARRDLGVATVKPWRPFIRAWP